jgi:hypothetical protein
MNNLRRNRMARILETNNYGKFVVSEFNRDVKKTWNLEASMQKYGWIDAYPLHVIRQEDGRLQIKDGHHRFYVAQKLSIPIKYVECKDEITMAEMVRATVSWSMKDFLVSFVRCGKAAYVVVSNYHKKTGIGLSACISMLAGDSAGSGNWNKQFKDGTYRLGDPAHADIVGNIVLHCKKCGFPWWNNMHFVQAVSKIAWAEGFDPQVLKSKIAQFPEHMKKQAFKDDYIKMLDAIYNRQSRTKVPLAFNAEEAARKRNAFTPKKGKSNLSPLDPGLTLARG